MRLNKGVIMESLKIGTWNIKNSYVNLCKNNIKSSSVIQLLNENVLDILALQEVNPLLARKIERKLVGSSYQITSLYEKPWSPIKNLSVEYNMIISRMTSYFNNNTITLPSESKDIHRFKFWNHRMRNIVIQAFENQLVINVTHLDFAPSALNRLQLDAILQIVKSQKKALRTTILAGNLNQKPNERNMREFMEELSQNGMKVLDNPHKTFIGHLEDQPVDYIIVPEDWHIVSVKTVEDYDEVSTHRPVVAELIKR